jgi:serine/threonine protein kinase/tetratricopeptide (TPR) repeat protein
METEPRIDSLVGRWEELRDHGTPLTIEELCADRPELVAEVRRRITALQAMDSALDTQWSQPQPMAGDGAGRGAVAGVLPAIMHAAAVYRPHRHHAHGGLGEVLTAHQEELDRTVALKRIRPDKLQETARRRFLREAAITARLQHPGIVPIYSLGQDDGGPFYTMPLIAGQTLQEAIEAFHGDESLGRDPGRRSLRLRTLLQHFITTCNTVAYAYDQGVVHRDLKPSNIMLGPYGETLVMDWGLAKRFGSDEASSEDEGDAPSPSPSPEEVTATGEILGTPRYMSPEQAKGEPAGPAGDIFSLGLVLYAILTGKSAYDESSFRGGDPLRAVREAAIVPPRRRDVSVPRGLEAICLKALAAKPEDRYASARALGEDVMRWLADEPVTAWREPVSIRARRWMRRHRTAVAAAVVALVAGVVGLGAVVGVQARANVHLKRANDETKAALAESEKSRKEEAAVSLFLVKTLRSPDPSQDGREVKVADVLDRASKWLDQEFAGSQPTKGALLNALGNTYLGLGLYDQAVDLHTKARAVREAALGLDHRDTLQSRSHLAVAFRQAGRTTEAIALQKETLELQEVKLGSDHPDTLESRNRLANAYYSAGRFSEAIALHKETLERREAKLGPDHPDTLNSRSNLANAYRASGRLPEAIALHKGTLERREATLGPDHPNTLEGRNNLANAYYSAGRFSEAIALHKETLERMEAKLGPGHPNTLKSRNNLAGVYARAGQTTEAIALHEQTLKVREAKLGPDHPDTLQSRDNLAGDYGEAGRLPEAIALHKETLERMEAKLGPDHPDTLGSRGNLANAYAQAGRLPEAIALYETTLKLWKAKLGPDHPDTLRGYGNLANAYMEAGRLPEAIALFEATIELWKAKLGPSHPETLFSRGNLATAYRLAGRTSEAIALYEGTLERMETNSGPDHPTTLSLRNGLASAYEDLGRWPEAEVLHRDNLARRRKTVPPDSPQLAGDLAALGHHLLEQSRWSEAEPLLREQLAIREKATPDDWRHYDSMSLLGGALLGQGRHADAEPLIVAGYEGMEARESRIPVPDRPSLRAAAERVIHLFESWGRLEQAAAWKTKLGMSDLPADVFARP